MKKLFFGIIFLAAVLTFMHSVEFRNSNTQNNLDIISFTLLPAHAEEDPPQLFDKTKSDCKTTIEGEVGISGTWMGINYTIPSSGEITVTCGNCDIDCPLGNEYLREDCTTRDCAD